MMSNLERLIYMANQIARNFAAEGREKAIAATADHIAHFWDPRMRQLISKELDAGNPAIGEIAGGAIEMLQDKGAPPPQTRATEFNGAHDAGHSDAG
jgi:formate dehydrogenase subunit delta